MTKHAKILCSLAIGATALVTFSLSTTEAFARSGVVRRVAATHAPHVVNRTFVRGKLSPYAASNLRKSKSQAGLRRQLLTEKHGDKDPARILAWHDQLGDRADDEAKERLTQKVHHGPLLCGWCRAFTGRQDRPIRQPCRGRSCDRALRVHPPQST